jgi:hypothetical protein
MPEAGTRYQEPRELIHTEQHQHPFRRYSFVSVCYTQYRGGQESRSQEKKERICASLDGHILSFFLLNSWHFRQSRSLSTAKKIRNSTHTLEAKCILAPISQGITSTAPVCHAAAAVLLVLVCKTQTPRTEGSDMKTQPSPGRVLKKDAPSDVTRLGKFCGIF